MMMTPSLPVFPTTTTATATAAAIVPLMGRHYELLMNCLSEFAHFSTVSLVSSLRLSSVPFCLPACLCMCAVVQ